MTDFTASTDNFTSAGPRVGLALAQCGPFADPAATIDMAAKAERSGFASLWVMDRVLAPLEPRTPYPASMDGELPAEQYSVLDPFVALTLAATATERIRLGTSVLVAPWYSPLLLARTLTAIDLASHGRLSVGLGLGWSVDEYDAVCAPLDHRGGRLDEIIDVLEAIWADGVTHVDGERYEIVPSEILPKPMQRPRPPLLLAAYTPSALDRVARRADAWIPAGLPIEAIGPMFGAVRDMAAGYGRDPDAIELVVRANASITLAVARWGPSRLPRLDRAGRRRSRCDPPGRRPRDHRRPAGQCPDRRRTPRAGDGRDVTAPRRRVRASV